MISTTDKDYQLKIDKFAYNSEANSEIIQNLSISFNKGEVVSIFGKSGLGKTTLLRIMAGLEPYPDLWNIKNIRVQMVFQDSRLFPWMNVLVNIKSGDIAERRKINSDRACELLDLMQLNHLKESWPRTLSGGEMARVALARSLIAKPDILLLDEPFRNLDIITRLDVIELIQSLRKIDSKLSIIMVTHSPEDAVLLSDKILYFNSQPLNSPIEIEIAEPHPRHYGSTIIISKISEISDVISSGLKGA